MIDLKKFGESIVALRKDQSMTGEKFAELLDVSPQAVSKWETGKNLPETALLPDISRLLGVSVDTLLTPANYPVKLHDGGHYIDGLPSLRWGKFQDCTWAGSIKLLLDAIGVESSYPEIMGFSGVCYYFSMTSDWCPSAAMPQIAYGPDVILEQALGVLHGSFTPEDRDYRVKEAISRGKPVMLVQPRVEMEWGVLCGYNSEGKFYGRSYFDYLKPNEDDIFTGNNYFSADSYPGADPNLIYFLSGRTQPMPLNNALKKSLEVAHTLYTAAPMHKGRYRFGLDAYDILLDGLNRDDTGFAAITQYGATGNGIILLARLIDARRSAHAFWMEKAQYLSSENSRQMRDVTGLYASIVSTLGDVLPNDMVYSTQNGYPFDAWSGDIRSRYATALVACKSLEQQAMYIITDVLKHW